MAVWTIKTCAELGSDLTLAPERYDPRRMPPLQHQQQGSSIPLSLLASPVRHVVSASSSELESCLVLDTSHAREGVVVGPYNIMNGCDLGSAKKVIKPGQVIISRLRSYLRQVAFVDRGLLLQRPNISLVCSTEFFVLEAVDEKAITFLVPFLLCEPIQTILAASQEGGHHPRFSEQTLMSLAIPTALVETRDHISHNVEAVVGKYREYERNISLLQQSITQSYMKTAK